MSLSWCGWPGTIGVSVWCWERWMDVHDSRKPCSKRLIVSFYQQVMASCPYSGITALVFFCLVSVFGMSPSMPQAPSLCVVILQPPATTKPVGTFYFYLSWPSLCLHSWWFVLCCSPGVVLSLHAPDRWIYVLSGCVRRALTGKLERSPDAVRDLELLSHLQLNPPSPLLVP